MDRREGMALSGAPAYYLNRGISGSGSAGAGGSGTPAGIPNPPGFKSGLFGAETGYAVQSNVGGSNMSSNYQVENSSQNFADGVEMGVASSVSPSDPVKKKRGRPRKYGPGGANMSLALSPLSTTPSSGSITPGPKRAKGRPPGTGWKQQLAAVGDWMSSSAGLAFTPHVLHADVGEDVAEKILAFAQQRPRALCILSANGTVSAVTLRPPASSGATVTYEGRFEILRFSGSYLVAENGGPRNRTGGTSISVCSPDGQVIGGAIGGKLIAASPVQVVLCSFVYGPKVKSKPETIMKNEESAEKSSTPVSAAMNQTPTSNSATGVWPQSSRPDLRNDQTEIDLTRG